MPSLGDLPDPGIEPACLMSPPLTDRFFTTMTTWVAQTQLLHVLTAPKCMGHTFLPYSLYCCGLELNPHTL